MEFVFVFIFAAILLFTLILKWNSLIAKKFVDLIMPETQEDALMKKELHDLSIVLRETNMVNEFARYARAERKVNKITEEMKQKGKSKSTATLKAKFAITVFMHTVQALVYLTLIYNYRSEPLIKLPSDWFWPVTTLVAFPTGIPGAVSVTFWILTCRSVVPRLLSLVVT